MIAYDAKGRKVGSSMGGFFGNINHYDNKGHKVGSTQKGAFSDDHYDSKGHRVRNQVWIGANSVICPGVTISDNVVIGAGSIVTKDIPDLYVTSGTGILIYRKRK